MAGNAGSVRSIPNMGRGQDRARGFLEYVRVLGQFVETPGREDGMIWGARRDPGRSVDPRIGPYASIWSAGIRNMANKRTFGSDRRSDATLLKACLAGDQDAWSALVERYHRLIYSVAMRQGLTAEDSADVVQTVLTIVLQRLESIQDRDRFSAWLITTTKREAWRVHRRALPADCVDELDIVDRQPLPEDEVIGWERSALVRIAVDSLGETCRELISALFFEERTVSYAELAERLHMSIGSIGPTRGRCFAKLASRLADEGVVDFTGSVAE